MIAAMSLLAATTRAWSGRSMTRGTISAARMPRITMTTRISIRVKPPARRRNVENLVMTVPGEVRGLYCARFPTLREPGRAVASTHQLVHLENRQEDRDHHEEHHHPHGEDQQRLQERRQPADPVLELARLSLGRAREHGVQPPGRFAARDEVDDERGKELRRAERG